MKATLVHMYYIFKPTKRGNNMCNYDQSFLGVTLELDILQMWVKVEFSAGIIKLLKTFISFCHRKGRRLQVYKFQSLERK